MMPQTIEIPLLKQKVSTRIWSILEHTAVNRISWSRRIANILNQREFHNLAEMAKMPVEDWLNIPNFGKASLVEIQHRITAVIDNSDYFQLKEEEESITSLEELGNRMLKWLKPGQQQVIRTYYGQPTTTLAAIGEVLGVSGEYVRQIRESANQLTNQKQQRRLIQETIFQRLHSAVDAHYQTEDQPYRQLLDAVQENLTITENDQWLINWLNAVFDNWLDFASDQHTLPTYPQLLEMAEAEGPEETISCSAQMEPEEPEEILGRIEICLRLGQQLVQQQRVISAIYLYQLVLEQQPGQPQISQALATAFQQKPVTDYEQWNRAIAEYFTAGFAAGDTIYLSVDETVLANIGSRLEADSNQLNWTERFTEVVLGQCVEGEEINLGAIYGYDRQGVPNCVGFLAICVLAAYQMRGEELDSQESVATHNYFTRLRQVLRMTDQAGGRPLGLKTGEEKPLWDRWNSWLTAQGFVTSAVSGESTADKYIHYPVSQALLREGDQQYLEKVFRTCRRNGQLQPDWGSNQLTVWLTDHLNLMQTSHLRALMHDPDFNRRQAFFELVYEVYSTIAWDQESTVKRRRRYLSAGLYRTEDPFMGQLSYYLYPQLPKRSQFNQLQLSAADGAYRLKPERSGWAEPLFELPVDLSGGQSYPIIGDHQLQFLSLPKRDFWILVNDPEYQHSSVMATWHSPPKLGEHFLLVCRPKYQQQMELYRQESLIDWDQLVPLPAPYQGWLEYHQCMVLSLDWDQVTGDRELVSALQPPIAASIRLQDGVKHKRDWLEGYLPQIMVTAFSAEVQLIIADAAQPQHELCQQSILVNQWTELPIDLNRGNYLLSVRQRDKVLARRTLRIMAWNDLEPADPATPVSLTVGGQVVRGAVITENPPLGQVI